MIRAFSSPAVASMRLANLREGAEIVLAFEHDDLDAVSARLPADFSHHVHIARISRTKAVAPSHAARRPSFITEYGYHRERVI